MTNKIYGACPQLSKGMGTCPTNLQRSGGTLRPVPKPQQADASQVNNHYVKNFLQLPLVTYSQTCPRPPKGGAGTSESELHTTE